MFRHLVLNSLVLNVLVAGSLGLAACGSDDDGGTDPADAGVGETLSFMDECDVDNDLCDAEDELFCFSFNNKGPHCSRACTVDEDCEAPSTGCNGMGVCKAP